MNKSLLFTALLLSTAVNAKDLGTWGDLYPIHEPDLLDTIRSRLGDMQASGELAEQQENFKQDVIANSLRPAPVAGLAIAHEDRTWFVDPTFILGRDIADQNGRVFAHLGQHVNPLDNVPFKQTLYFIDADDKRQVAWMKKQMPDTELVKVILVKGNIRDASDALNTRVYFDQQGALTSRFNLKAVPARVTAAADGRRLQVEEFGIAEVTP
jgi:conjugal transfer pilus assembly protein TraW